MEIKVVNEKDLEDLLISLDLAIKNRAIKEDLDKRLVPKIMFGENKEYLDNASSHVYERPFLTFMLERRGPASISKTDFFEAPHQHGPYFARQTENGERKSILKDNRIKLTLRTKSKKEQIALMHFLERVFTFENFQCILFRYMGMEEQQTIQNEFYKVIITFCARTETIVDYIDDGILEEVKITYKHPICKYFNLETYKCDKTDSEKYNQANDFDCYSLDFCKNFLPRYSFDIK